MVTPVVNEVPVESRNKYGVTDDWEEAGNEFATALVGGNRGAGGDRRPPTVPTSQTDDDVDEEFLRQAGNPSAHYGR